MAETSSSTTVSTKLERIAKLAREMPQAALTTLAHHIDIDWLREAYRRTRKDGATGIDRQTAEEYARNLEENLRSLLERAKSGSYVAPPGRRVHIPKAGDGSQTRPIGIPTFEDKVLQRAVAMVLEPAYEQSFYVSFSQLSGAVLRYLREWRHGCAIAISSSLGFGPAAWLHTPDSEENSTPNNSGSDILRVAALPPFYTA